MGINVNNDILKSITPSYYMQSVPHILVLYVFRGKMISAELEAAIVSTKKKVNAFLRGDLRQFLCQD